MYNDNCKIFLLMRNDICKPDDIWMTDLNSKCQNKMDILKET